MCFSNNFKLEFGYINCKKKRFNGFDETIKSFKIIKKNILTIFVYILTKPIFSEFYFKVKNMIETFKSFVKVVMKGFLTIFFFFYILDELLKPLKF